MFGNERLEAYATKDDYTGKNRPKVVITIADEGIARDIADYFKAKAMDALEGISGKNSEKEAEEFLHICNEIKAGCERVFNNVEESEGTENEPVRD